MATRKRRKTDSSNKKTEREKRKVGKTARAVRKTEGKRSEKGSLETGKRGIRTAKPARSAKPSKKSIKKTARRHQRATRSPTKKARARTHLPTAKTRAAVSSTVRGRGTGAPTKKSARPRTTAKTSRRERELEALASIQAATKKKKKRNRAQKKRREAAALERARIDFLAGKVALPPLLMHLMREQYEDVRQGAMADRPKDKAQFVEVLSGLRADGRKAKSLSILRHIDEKDTILAALNATLPMTSTEDEEGEEWMEDSLWQMAQTRAFGELADKIATMYRVDIREVYTLFFST